MKDYSFQGIIYLGERLTGGKPGALRDVGNAPKCELSLSNEQEKKKESRTGQRMVSAILDKGKEATLALTLDYASIENLALGLYGTEATVAGGTVTDEAIPAGIAAGEFFVLEHGGVSALTIETSADVAMVAGTDYRVVNANGGLIEVLDASKFATAAKASYTHTAGVNLTMFTATPPERYLLLDGVNTTGEDAGSPVRVRLYRVKFNPQQSLGLIHESFGSIELTAEVMYDVEAVEDAALGGFGKLELYAAVGA